MSGFGNRAAARSKARYEAHGLCCYPSCKVKRINADEPLVVWEGVLLDRRIVEDALAPMAKLAAVANPTTFIELYGVYPVNLEMHPECAAEWGMQLIHDAFKIKSEVGRTLRKSVVKKEPEDGLCEQTPPV